MGKKSIKDTIIYMYKPVFKNKKVVLSSVINAVCGGLVPVLSAYLLRLTINYITSSKGNLKELFLTLGTYIVIIAGFEIIVDQTMNKTYSFFNRLRAYAVSDIISFFNTMDYKYFEDAEFMNNNTTVFRAVQSNNIGIEGIYHRIYDMGKSFVTVILLGVIIAMETHISIVFILLISVAFSIFIKDKINKRKYQMQPKLNKSMRKLEKYNKDSSDFSFGKDMRIYSAFKKLKQYITQEITRYEKVLSDIQSYEISLTLINSFVYVSCNGLVYFMLLKHSLQNLNISIFIFSLSIVSLLINGLNDLAEDIGFIKEEFQYVHNMVNFLNRTDLKTEGRNKSLIENKNLDDFRNRPISITFDHVYFKYPNTNRWILKNISFDILPHKKLALVGVNGAGKTTIMKLLCGLYRPTKGRILINNIDYTHFSNYELQNMLSIVFQDSEPIAFTIRENIACNTENIDDTLVEKSLKQVGLWDKVNSFEKGINSMMLKVVDDNGILLSGGENQKLMIARALYRQKSKFLIMDEPTAALDALAEEKMYQEFNMLIGEKACLFISHRLASTRFCDKIILLNDGRIEEIGTHEQLLDNDGLYKKMFDMQGKYYKEEV